MPNKTYVIGVGMTHFDKPGRKTEVDYPDYCLEASTKALLDANVTYDSVEFAAVGFINADSASGQRALYQLGLTQIPIINVNNNCSTGSTALYMARNAVASGQAECALALGFEKMAPGSLGSNFPDRTAPLDWGMASMMELRDYDPKAPMTPQIFGNAAIEYGETYKNGADCDEAMHYIASKSHTHSTLNPYSQFNQPATVDQVKKARKVYGPMTLLHCSPTSDGAACAIIASEAFVIKHNLGPQAIELTAQVMATDSTLAFDPTGKKKSCVEIAGADMTRTAVKKLYSQAGISAQNVDVCELHDCFSGNELITYDALGLCPPGQAVPYTLSGATFLPKFWKGPPVPAHFKKVPVNTSGGLISKGHPLGATGIAQCAELVWQLRGWCESRQVPNATRGLQHNVGLGGAVVISLYTKPESSASVLAAKKGWQDPRERFGYNPAASCRGVRESDVRKILSSKGSLLGLPSGLNEAAKEKVEAVFAAKL
ncbi:thiolase-like protein [Chytriomyces sp. MP71]|nr:thiolase-like protein [Chytriomyces sp. MP71]